MKIACKNVLGGWQTMLTDTGEVFGPVFQSTTDLWKWQTETFAVPQNGMDMKQLSNAVEKIVPFLQEAGDPLFAAAELVHAKMGELTEAEILVLQCKLALTEARADLFTRVCKQYATPEIEAADVQCTQESKRK